MESVRRGYISHDNIRLIERADDKRIAMGTCRICYRSYDPYEEKVQHYIGMNEVLLQAPTRSLGVFTSPGPQ
jgi:hypothetical protein